MTGLIIGAVVSIAVGIAAGVTVYAATQRLEHDK